MPNRNPVTLDLPTTLALVQCEGIELRGGKRLQNHECPSLQNSSNGHFRPMVFSRIHGGFKWNNNDVADPYKKNTTAYTKQSCSFTAVAILSIVIGRGNWPNMEGEADTNFRNGLQKLAEVYQRSVKHSSQNALESLQRQLEKERKQHAQELTRARLEQDRLRGKIQEHQAHWEALKRDCQTLRDDLEHALESGKRKLQDAERNHERTLREAQDRNDRLRHELEEAQRRTMDSGKASSHGKPSKSAVLAIMTPPRVSDDESSRDRGDVSVPTVLKPKDPLDPRPELREASWEAHQKQLVQTNLDQQRELERCQDQLKETHRRYNQVNKELRWKNRQMKRKLRSLLGETSFRIDEDAEAMDPPPPPSEVGKDSKTGGEAEKRTPNSSDTAAAEPEDGDATEPDEPPKGRGYETSGNNDANSDAMELDEPPQGTGNKTPGNNDANNEEAGNESEETSNSAGDKTDSPSADATTSNVESNDLVRNGNGGLETDEGNKIINVEEGQGKPRMRTKEDKSHAPDDKKDPSSFGDTTSLSADAKESTSVTESSVIISAQHSNRDEDKKAINDNDKEWNKMYEKLKRFHEKHKHCSVKLTQDKSLFEWVKNQKIAMSPIGNQKRERELSRWEEVLLNHLDVFGSEYRRREKELEQYVGKRIAKFFDTVVTSDDENGDDNYNETDGNMSECAVWKSKKRKKSLGQTKPFFGTIKGISSVCNMHLHVSYDDGDSEDLDETEREEGLQLYETYKHLDTKDTPAVTASADNATVHTMGTASDPVAVVVDAIFNGDARFDWETSQNRSFREYVQDLQKHKDTNQNFDIHPNQKKEDLGAFVTFVRTEHDKFLNGGGARITTEEIRYLEEIGFNWKPSRRKRRRGKKRRSNSSLQKEGGDRERSKKKARTKTSTVEEEDTSSKRTSRKDLKERTEEDRTPKTTLQKELDRDFLIIVERVAGQIYQILSENFGSRKDIYVQDLAKDLTIPIGKKYTNHRSNAVREALNLLERHKRVIIRDDRVCLISNDPLVF